MTDPHARRREIAGYALLAAALGLATMGIVRCAWLCDDAYITLRTVDNFVHGYGLRWNIDERVQTYTHPLWMFLLSLGYAITHEPYYTTLFISIATAVAGLVVLGFNVARTRAAGILAVLVACASHAFIDYSTSGLENPLSDLLLTLLAWLMFRRQTRRRILWLTLVASLLLLNRADYLLLVGPAIAWEIVSQRSRSALKQAALGAAPLILWELFSLFYYGSLVPNTAYAKLNYSVPRKLVLEQGLRWLWYTLSLDWVTVLAIVAATAGAVWKRHVRGIAWCAGCLLYVGYSVWIGGDFMGGRFWLAPFMVALSYLAQCPLPASGIAMAGMLATTLLLPLRPASYGGDPRDALGYHHGVWDERHSYFDALGLINVGLDARGPLHEWGRWGIEEGKKMRSTVRSAVGMHGYYAGTGLHIVDDLALCDPLVARLRPFNSSEMTVGHFKRHLPAGYFFSVLGDNVIVEPHLHEYYDHLRLVTRGPLFSWHRLVETFKLVTGRYNHLLRAYEESLDHAQKHVDRARLFAAESDGPECTSCVTFYETADLTIGEPVFGAINCSFLADNDRDYRLQFLDKAHFVDQVFVKAAGGDHGLHLYKLTMPRPMSSAEFDAVHIQATKGDPPYTFGGIECTTASELP